MEMTPARFLKGTIFLVYDETLSVATRRSLPLPIRMRAREHLASETIHNKLAKPNFFYIPHVKKVGSGYPRYLITDRLQLFFFVLEVSRWIF